MPAPESRTQLALQFRHSRLVPLGVSGGQLQQLGQPYLRKGRVEEEGQGARRALWREVGGRSRP